MTVKENVADNLLAQIEAHLKECNDAEKALRAQAKALRKAAKRGDDVEYDTIQAAIYAFGSAARWFLHPIAPQRFPSPSLESDERLGRHRKGGEAEPTGVV